MNDERQNQQGSGARPAYTPPRAMRMGEMHTGKGDCNAGSGDTVACSGPGNSAYPTCTTGNGAPGSCAYSGISASITCIETGNSAT